MVSPSHVSIEIIEKDIDNIGNFGTVILEHMKLLKRWNYIIIHICLWLLNGMLEVKQVLFIKVNRLSLELKYLV